MPRLLGQHVFCSRLSGSPYKGLCFAAIVTTEFGLPNTTAKRKKSIFQAKHWVQNQIYVLTFLEKNDAKSQFRPSDIISDYASLSSVVLDDNIYLTLMRRFLVTVDWTRCNTFTFYRNRHPGHVFSIYTQSISVNWLWWLPRMVSHILCQFKQLQKPAIGTRCRP